MSKLIITTGYMGSGSSAATDFVSEFENVNNKHKTFEYIFLHCPNGVFDLEDKLLKGNNSIRSDEAIHSFINEMNDLYNKKFWWPGNYKNVFGERFLIEVNKYVDKLVDAKVKNYWYYSEKPNKVMQIKAAFKEIIKRLTLNKVIIKKSTLYDELLLSYKSEDEFYKITKKFINNVLNLLYESKSDLLLDQLLLPHNLYRMDKYFDDNTKVIVVDRDPRDVFVLNKYAWSKYNSDVPYSHDVKQFCKQFKNIRENEIKNNNKNILRIHFEDLVYNYDKTSKIITKFLGYTDKMHVNKLKRFNPELSIRNTQVFNSDKKYKEEIKYIERELKDYLYEFNRKVVSKVENTFD